MTGVVAEVEETIGAPREAVWAALTEPDKIATWMAGSQVETDWTPGSPITWMGEYDGKAYEDKGTVVAVDAPNRLEVTHFSPLTGQDDVPENYHTLVYTLDAAGDSTRLSLTQDNNADQAEADRNAEGWKQMLGGLKASVEGS